MHIYIYYRRHWVHIIWNFQRTFVKWQCFWKSHILSITGFKKKKSSLSVLGVKSWIIHCVAAQIVSNIYRIIIFHAVLDETALIKFMLHFTDLKDLRVSILQFTAYLLKKVRPHLGYPPVLFSSRSWLYISLKLSWLAQKTSVKRELLL